MTDKSVVSTSKAMSRKRSLIANNINHQSSNIIYKQKESNINSNKRRKISFSHKNYLINDKYEKDNDSDYDINEDLMMSYTEHKPKRKIQLPKNNASTKNNKPSMIKLHLKRTRNSNTNTVPKDIIQKIISNKKRNIDPRMKPSDMFPYSGPILTRIRPILPSYPTVIPSYSRWFKLDRIHPLEYQSLPSIFVYKSIQTHQRYMEIRNFIVNTYRMNPRIYLSLTACRRMIAFDAGMIFNIHKCLEEWGIINYQTDDGSMPEYELPMLDYTHIETPFGIKIALKPTTTPTLKPTVNKKKDNFFMQRENLFANAIAQTNDIECVFCGIDCSQSRFRCVIEESMIFCIKCFNDKRYPMIFIEKDFEMELNIIHSTINNTEIVTKVMNEWTSDLDQKLEKALKKFKDNWEKVSIFVGRSKEECIAHFLQLPLRDAFLDSVEENRQQNIAKYGERHKINHPDITSFVATSISTTNPNAHQLSFLNPRPIHTASPFADIAHPILGQAAALSALINSELVDISSSAALKFLNNKTKYLQIINDVMIGDVIKTTFGSGTVLQLPITDSQKFEVQFEWGSAMIENADIIARIKDANGEIISQLKWKQYPKNIKQSKAKAAGIIGSSAILAKALNIKQKSHVNQLLQHLVLLQSKKIKVKMKHLEELSKVMQSERVNINQMKKELFRERIELQKERLMNKNFNDENIEEEKSDDVLMSEIPKTESNVEHSIPPLMESAAKSIDKSQIVSVQP